VCAPRAGVCRLRGDGFLGILAPWTCFTGGAPATGRVKHPGSVGAVKCRLRLLSDVSGDPVAVDSSLLEASRRMETTGRRGGCVHKRSCPLAIDWTTTNVKSDVPAEWRTMEDRHDMIGGPEENKITWRFEELDMLRCLIYRNSAALWIFFGAVLIPGSIHLLLTLIFLSALCRSEAPSRSPWRSAPIFFLSLSAGRNVRPELYCTAPALWCFLAAPSRPPARSPQRSGRAPHARSSLSSTQPQAPTCGSLLASPVIYSLPELSAPSRVLLVLQLWRFIATVPCPLRALLFVRVSSPSLFQSSAQFSLLPCRGRRAPARSSRPASPCYGLSSSLPTLSSLFPCLSRAQILSARHSVLSFRTIIASVARSLATIILTTSACQTCNSIYVTLPYRRQARRFSFFYARSCRTPNFGY
jgi:hypothetical protein